MPSPTPSPPSPASSSPPSACKLLASGQLHVSKRASKIVADRFLMRRTKSYMPLFAGCASITMLAGLYFNAVADVRP